MKYQKQVFPVSGWLRTDDKALANRLIGIYYTVNRRHRTYFVKQVRTDRNGWFETMVSLNGKIGNTYNVFAKYAGTKSFNPVTTTELTIERG